MPEKKERKGGAYKRAFTKGKEVFAKGKEAYAKYKPEYDKGKAKYLEFKNRQGQTQTSSGETPEKPASNNTAIILIGAGALVALYFIMRKK